jgi:DNA invertase Pin-like site-specific DNA recombinase
VRAVVYLRVSTDKQAEDGLGLDVQRKAVAAWARAGDHEIVAWYEDAGVSGSNGLDTRPGLAAAFRALEAGHAGLLLVYRLDRLSRKLGSQITWIERLEARGCHVVSVTEPDVGQDEMRNLVRHILGAIAEYERATIVRRMQDGRALKAERGGYAYGSPPYGWTSVAGELVPADAEQQVITRMAALRDGGASYRDVAAALNAQGLAPKRGAAWHPMTVRRALARAAGVPH